MYSAVKNEEAGDLTRVYGTGQSQNNTTNFQLK